MLDRATIEQICGVGAKFRVADRRIRAIFTDRFTKGGDWTRDGGGGPPPLVIYELIAHLVKHGVVDHIITFNFDELLDSALENEIGSEGFRRIFSGYEPLAIHDPPKPTLVKIHGTVSSPETMRFTYLDVSVLTREMRAHLETILKLTRSERGRPQPRTKPIHFVSLGYSWRDRNFAHWLEGKRKHIAGVTVVRQSSAAEPGKRRLQPILPEYLQAWGGQPPPLDVISTTDLAAPASHRRSARESVSLDDLCWVLTDQVFGRVKTPVQPVARHLLLGTLFGARAGELEASDLLQSRARSEIILHLAKSKGFIHTGSAPTLPRVGALVEQFRQNIPPGATATEFLQLLGLESIMDRSPEPEAWDTYFATARTRNDFVKGLTKELLRFAVSRKVATPAYEQGRIISRAVRMRSFVAARLEEIVNSADVEVLKRANPEVEWSFVDARPLPTFGHFSQHVADLLCSEWTHLLSITESLRWLTYPWMRAALDRCRGSRTILAVLPSERGLEQWHLRKDFLRGKPELRAGLRVRTANIPWWEHNRHVILAIRLRHGNSRLLGGVYFARPLRSAGIAPIAVDKRRDQAKLLGVLLRYCRRLDSPDDAEPGFRTAVAELVEGLLAENVFDGRMRHFVSELYQRLPETA